MHTLPRSLIRTAHHYPFRFAMGDNRRLRNVWAGQKMVGILLPPSVPGALVNFAASLSGKIPVNLNYSASNETLASCAQQCNLQTVITTKLLLEKIPLQVPAKTILLEEAAG